MHKPALKIEHTSLKTKGKAIAATNTSKIIKVWNRTALYCRSNSKNKAEPTLLYIINDWRSNDFFLPVSNNFQSYPALDFKILLTFI